MLTRYFSLEKLEGLLLILMTEGRVQCCHQKELVTTVKRRAGLAQE